ncbi:MAG TPA: 2-phosphosulfolactate phosphatase [Clostridia bacterium]|nr:2-phosphosulfolactate phosphatase [Clostridia bacterium]
MTAQCLAYTDTAVHPTVVVYDVLRATSTITTALAHGAKEIIPVLEVDEALSLYAGLKKTTGQVLLGGERRGDPIPGFHLGNSPLEYTEDKVRGKTIILTTTNGTRALLHSRRKGAQKIIIGSLLNQQQVVRALLNEPAITVVCAGVNGAFALEDFFAAGLMLLELIALQPDYALDDGALAALHAARGAGEGPAVIAASTAAQRLKNQNRWKDVEFCTTPNLFPVLPVFHNHRVVLDSAFCSR